MPPAGFEPAHPPPEDGALSPELRGRELELYLIAVAGLIRPTFDRRRPIRTDQPVGAVNGNGCAPRVVSMPVIWPTSEVCASSILLAKLRTTPDAA